MLETLRRLFWRPSSFARTALQFIAEGSEVFEELGQDGLKGLKAGTDLDFARRI